VEGRKNQQSSGCWAGEMKENKGRLPFNSYKSMRPILDAVMNSAQEPKCSETAVIGTGFLH
jgi:hypothetical protein